MNDWYAAGSELLKGIGLIIVGSFLTWIYKKLQTWLILSRPISKVLGTFASAEEIIIVIPKLYSNQPFLGKDPLNPQHTILWSSNFALFAEGDSKAIMYLYRFLIEFRKGKKVKIKSDTELSGRENEQELICVGAGSNDLTRDFQTIARPRIEFGQAIQRGTQLFGLNIHDRQTNETWTANRTDDYGLIIRWKNPRNSNADIFIIAGLGPSGTAAAGYYLSNKWKEIYDYLKRTNAFNKNYEVLIKTKRTDHTYSTLIKIVTVD